MAYLCKEPIVPSAVKLKNIYLRDPEKGRQLICELLDVLMEPSRQSSARSEELADWVKHLFTTEKSFEEFCSKVSVYDRSPFCGCVWTKDFVAYRCKTCATSPCMSICAACFEKGDHHGHEYNIFRSEAGGACDCGDASVMLESGFCIRHGTNRVASDNVPANLLTLPKMIMERILIMLLHSLRFIVKDSFLESSYPNRMPESLCKTLDVFIEAIKCGSPIRSWVADLLLSEDYYTKLNTKQHYGGVVSAEMRNFHDESVKYFAEAVKRLPKCVIPAEVKVFNRGNYVYKNVLQELIFWLCRYEYQEHLVLFVLNMLPDSVVKQSFARYFVQHYIYISPSLIRASNVEEYSNRIVHISVQLFSNNELAYTLANEEGLLETFVVSLYYMVTQRLVESSTTDADFHQMVTTSEGLRSNAHWAIVSDLVNCLGHHDVVKLFLRNDVALEIWMRVLTCFSGMNLTVRQFDRHIEYDPDPHNVLLAFYSEREACAAPFWVMIDAMRDGSTLDLAMKVIKMCKDTIVELLDALGVDDPKGTGIPFHIISFHYPVHRYFSLFVANAISRQGFGMLQLGIEANLARTMMAHPLQVLCTAQEIHNNMWARNGMHAMSQQLAYRQSFFSTFFIDADLFSLQLLSCYMSPDIFVSSIFDRCRVTNCLTVESETPSLRHLAHGALGQPEVDRLPKMLESAFTILLSVLSISTQLGIPDKTIIENELIAVLCSQNWTYSELLERIPQCHDMHAGEKSKRFTKPLATAIDDLAEMIEGDAMAQTKYSLRDEVWPRYDPIFNMHRSLYRKTVQQAHTNYFKYLQRKCKLPSSTLESTIWPPYKPIRITDNRYTEINKILNCRTLHTTIFMILYKFLHKHSSVTEQTLAMAVTILDGCLFASPNERNPENRGKATAMDTGSGGEEEWRKMLNKWFKSDYMSINIRQVIDQVQLSSETTDIFHDAMESDEQLENLPDEPECCIVIQESILTLLIKLHNKFAGNGNSFVFPVDFVPNLDPPSPVITTAQNIITKVLLFAASKSLENQKVIVDICGSSVRDAQSRSENKSKMGTERERRKQAALAMQQKLLKEFANQQKKFLEQAEMDLDLSNDSIEDENPTSSDENKYECVVCGASGESSIRATEPEREDSTRSQIMGLVCLVQFSSVLGIRTESDDHRVLRPPGCNVRQPETCRKLNLEFNDHLKSIYNMSDSSKGISGRNLDWEKSPHVSTCGHHLHVSCYHDYMNWVRRDETGYLRFESGLGFQCPICRQTSNMIVPCNIVEARKSPDTIIKTVEGSSQIGDSYVQSIQKIQNLFVPRGSILRSSCVEDFGFGSSVDRIAFHPSFYDTATGEDEYYEYTEIEKACKESCAVMLKESSAAARDGGFLTNRGLLQGQLEFELCHYGGTLILEKKPSQLGTVARKIPLGPLFHVLMKLIKKLTPDTGNTVAQLWNHLTIYNISETAKIGNCPLLFKDPVSLLLEFCAAIYPFTLEEYQTVVSILYNLALVEALIQISCKFSPEERRAWKSNSSVSLGGVPFSSLQLSSMLGFVISLLPQSLYEDSSATSNFLQSSTLAFTSTVWTSQSVQSSVEDLLLHFLRISSLLQFHVFENMNLKSVFPGTPKGENEFLHLSKYLGIVDGSTIPVDNLCTSIAKWPTTPQILIRKWCKEIKESILSDRAVSFSLLTRHRIWKQPSIINLPDDYTNLFNKFRNIICPRCETKASQPCVCLMCGEFVCYLGGCLHRARTFPVGSPDNRRTQSAIQHAKQCGNGTTILLHIHNTTLIIIRGTRSCVWGSLYLDQHGEEDRGWKRGKQLVLKQQRLKLLNYQWVNHVFDNACRGWTMHRNNL